MKKKIEAELVSLAHRILLLKNKSDIAVLHEEARHLYEKLSVLRFMEAHFSEAQPTIGKSQAFDLAESAFEKPLDKASEEPKIVVGELPSEEELEREEEQNAPEAATASDQKEPEKESETQAERETQAQQEPAEPRRDEPSEEPKPQDAPPAPETEEPEQTPPAVEEPKETPEVPVTATSPTLEETAHFHQPESVAEVAASQAEDPEAITKAVESLEQPKKEQFTIDPVFKPAFDLEFEPKTPSDKQEAKTEKSEPVADAPAPQFTFDDLLGKDYADPVFVKPEENTAANTGFTPPSAPAPKSDAPAAPKSGDRNTLNDRLSKGITIGLNDRIAFMKHLFNNSSEDYNRVLSQLMTFDTYEDARMFIDDMVRPDYNNWEGKDEYAERFLEIVQKRFS